MIPRPEAVALLNDIDDEALDRFLDVLGGARKPVHLIHKDGRPLTAEEERLFLSIHVDEFRAAAEACRTMATRSRAAADQAKAHQRDCERLIALAGPYMTTAGTTLGEAVPLMPEAEQAEALQIMARLSGR